MASAPTFKSLREAAEAGYHGKAVNIEGKGLQKVAFADKAYDRRMAERSARANASDSASGSGTRNAPTESARPQARRRSVDDIARTATAAINRAEGRPATRPQQNPRRVPGPNEGTATSVETPRIERSSLPASAPMPAAVRSAVESAETPEQRRGAQRIAEEGNRKRIPGGAIVQAIRNYLRGEGPTDPSMILREGRLSGMARGGMVKKGKTDRRGKGMFYDSKSPRGYK